MRHDAVARGAIRGRKLCRAMHGLCDSLGAGQELPGRRARAEAPLVVEILDTVPSLEDFRQLSSVFGESVARRRGWLFWAGECSRLAVETEACDGCATGSCDKNSASCASRPMRVACVGETRHRHPNDATSCRCESGVVRTNM
jgi:hypothetical protein